MFQELWQKDCPLKSFTEQPHESLQFHCFSKSALFCSASTQKSAKCRSSKLQIIMHAIRRKRELSLLSASTLCSENHLISCIVLEDRKLPFIKWFALRSFGAVGSLLWRWRWEIMGKDFLFQSDNRLEMFIRKAFLITLFLLCGAFDLCKDEK